MMQKLIQSTTRVLAILFAVFATSGAWATDITKNNPVTGESQTYSYKYVGSGSWNATDWQDANAVAPQNAPGTDNSNIWDAMLVDSTADISVTKLNGWTLQLGVFGGADVTVGTLGFWTGSDSCFAAVDADSTLTFSATTGNNWNNTVKFYVANSSGITFTSAFAPANPNGTGNIHYYLTGNGSVAYSASLGGAVGHVIKQADITLSGTSQVASKTLVSFASTDKTFTADATIKVLNESTGAEVATKTLTTVNAAASLTTADAVGTCELVQTSTGIDLYWVDGDPAALTPTVYNPSININFTNGAGNGLTTAADVGLAGYEVPGTSWNNYVVANSTFNTVNAIDSTGAASAMSGVSVTISNVSGSWSCSGLTASSDFRQSYIDESAAYSTPTVTVSGIPYYKYRVLVYHSTDTASVPFGYDTINGTDYTYVNDALAEGTTAWGNSGAKDSANAIAEGGNVLVTGELSGSTLTVVGHRAGGASNARGCIAAIQIIEVKADVGENDLEIAVDGETEYTVTAEDAEKTGTVYLTGLGTLTLAGENKISAATIEISEGVTLVVNADRLDATAFTGSGTVVYDDVVPPTGKGWTDSTAWKGTVWIKNQSVAAFEGTNYGNVGSTVRFTGVTGYLQTSSYNNTYVHTVPLELVDDGNTAAFTYNNGWSGYLVKINTLKGTGTLKTQENGLGEHIYIVDGSGFTGVFNLTGKYVYVGGSQPDNLSSTNPDGKLEIRSGVTMTVPSGKTWTANGGFVVNGTLNVDGTLASSHTTKAVSGSGTVVFTGRAPTVSGDAWWKNADWTGTVLVKAVTNMVGDSRTGVWLKFNDYGNSGSVVEMNNVTGWLESGYTCTVPLKITGTLYLNNGSSGKAYAFKVGTLLGSGTISGDGSADKVVFNVTTDWSGFTGTIGLNNKCVVFGETIPDSLTAGTIYVSSGAVVTPQQSSGTWWAVGGIQVDGELRAPNLDKFGGGTTITTSDSGVFTLTTSANTNDSTTDYARITGTGTLRYADASNIWRVLSQNNFPTNMICENNLSEGLVLPTPNAMHTIGSLAGSGKIRSDFSSGNRNLTILQAKDTTWSGVFGNDDRVGTVTVDSGASSTGTLTLSGIQTHDNSLTVNGSVNLTGTWVGATTVAGTFGGTGTLTGNLTFSDGATFKVYDGTDPIAVSGTVTFPTADNETATIDLTGVALDPAGTTLISGASSIGDIDNVSANGAILKVESGALKAYPVASLTKADDSVVTYTTAQAAVNATPYNSGYKYVTIYQSNVSVTMADTSLKLKLADGVTGVTVSNPFDEFAISSSTESGVTTYTLANNPTVYTWDSGTSVGVWNSMVVTPWRYSKNDTPTQANRAPASGDDVIFASGASVTVGEDISVDSITNSAALTFTKSSSDVTITATTGGIVLTDAAASITVTGVTLSPEPTAADTTNYRVRKTTVDGTTTYTVVDKVGTIFSVY